MNPTRNYYENGKLLEEVWIVDGKLHRLEGPACQLWHRNGQLWQEEWWIGHYLHRVEGPALQVWHENGTLASDSWWIDGEKVESISDPLAWALFVAKNFGNTHGLEKFCYDNLEDKAMRAILASVKIL